MKIKFGLTTLITLMFSSVLFAQNYGGWIITDSMLTGREDHAAIQLNDGNILVSGGYTLTDGNGSNQVEIFDISKQKWNTAAPMKKGRAIHNLIKLNDGSILAVGGFSEVTCEILNKNYSAWSFTDSLKKRRYNGQSVTLMQDGNVLLAGGYYFLRTTNRDTAWKECELYNYLKKEWTVVKDLNIGRYDHTATLLKDGKILVTGGTLHQNGVQLINSCEIYDPKTNEWTFAEPMNYPRARHSATLLSDGKVLVIGGQQKISELYDPVINKWTTVGSVNLASGHNTAITLKNEEYLLLVHDVDGYIFNPGWELYSLKSFTSIYNETFKRFISDQVVVKLNESNLLVAGGQEAKVTSGDLLLLPVNLSLIYNIYLTDIANQNNKLPLPLDFQISCYPNPFNNQINITVKINNTSMTSIKVYNALGSEISEVYNGELTEGSHLFKYDMNNFSSGVYFIQMISVKQKKEIKIIHLK